jgi:hypothetical protein
LERDVRDDARHVIHAREVDEESRLMWIRQIESDLEIN